jgi:hypothetical protein
VAIPRQIFLKNEDIIIRGLSCSPDSLYGCFSVMSMKQAIRLPSIQDRRFYRCKPSLRLTLGDTVRGIMDFQY